MDDARELDRQVAEKVMGWTNVRDSDGWGHWTGDPPEGYIDWFNHMQHTEGELPYYSTDIAAGWEVHKVACGWLFSRRVMYLAGLEQESRLPDGGLPRGLHVLVVLRDRMAEAVCRAALTALAAGADGGGAAASTIQGG